MGNEGIKCDGCGKTPASVFMDIANGPRTTLVCEECAEKITKSSKQEEAIRYVKHGITTVCAGCGERFLLAELTVYRGRVLCSDCVDLDILHGDNPC